MTYDMDLNLLYDFISLKGNMIFILHEKTLYTSLAEDEIMREKLRNEVGIPSFTVISYLTVLSHPKYQYWSGSNFEDIQQ